MGGPVAALLPSGGGCDEQGYPKHGQAPEEHPHPMPPLWKALLPQAEAPVRFMWIRCHRTYPQVWMGQEVSPTSELSVITSSFSGTIPSLGTAIAAVDRTVARPPTVAKPRTVQESCPDEVTVLPVLPLLLNQGIPPNRFHRHD